MRVKRWPVVFLFGAALLLSGCFKVNTRIEVRPDGSGQWLIGWAMNQDLRRWSSSSEGSQLNTAELLKRFQGEGVSLTAQDLKVREWTEGEFVAGGDPALPQPRRTQRARHALRAVRVV